MEGGGRDHDDGGKQRSQHASDDGGADTMKLKDRVAIVTGGGSGIGAASAIAFAAEGARVIVADLDEANGKRTVETIEKAGGRAVALQTDVTKAAANQAAVERAMTLWSRLDIFFANA